MMDMPLPENKASLPDLELVSKQLGDLDLALERIEDSSSGAHRSLGLTVREFERLQRGMREMLRTMRSEMGRMASRTSGSQAGAQRLTIPELPALQSSIGRLAGQIQALSSQISRGRGGSLAGAALTGVAAASVVRQVQQAPMRTTATGAVAGQAPPAPVFSSARGAAIRANTAERLSSLAQQVEAARTGAGDAGSVRSQLAGLKDSELRSLRDQLGLKGGQSTEEVQGVIDAHLADPTAKSKTKQGPLPSAREAIEDLPSLETALGGDTVKRQHLQDLQGDLGVEGGAKTNAERAARILEGARAKNIEAYELQQESARRMADAARARAEVIAPSIGVGSSRDAAIAAARQAGAEGLNSSRAGLLQAQAGLDYLGTAAGRENLQQSAEADVKANNARSISDLERQLARQKEINKLASSPEGKKTLENRKRLTEEIARLEKENMRLQGEGEKKAPRMPGSPVARLQQTASAAGSVWATGSAGILGMAAAADPFMTFPTFTESVKGLAIELGQSLLPTIDSMSGGLQSLTRWVSGLDPVMKKNIASWAVWGVAGAGGLWAVAKAAAIAAGPIIAFGKAVVWAQAAFALTPLGTAVVVLGGIAAAAGVAAGAYYGLRAAVSAAADAMGDIQGKGMPGGPRERAENLIKTEEYRGLPDATRKKLEEAAKKGGGTFAEELGAARKKAQEELEALKRKHGAEAAADAPKLKIAETIQADITERLKKGEAEIDRRLPARAETEVDPRTGATRLTGRTLQNPAATEEKERLRRQMAFEADRQMRESGVGAVDRQSIIEAISKGGKMPLPGDAARNAALKGAEDRLKILESLSSRAGGGEGAAAGIMRAYSNLPKPQILTQDAYADKVQITALSADGELRAQNLDKQLRALSQVETTIITESRAIRDAVQALNFWR